MTHDSNQELIGYLQWQLSNMEAFLATEGYTPNDYLNFLMNRISTDDREDD
jgi:hypothetical protein